MEKQTLNHRKDRNPRQVKQVFHGMKGGIPVKVHHSTTPKSENALTQILPNTELTGYRPELQRQQKTENGIWLSSNQTSIFFV